MNLSLVADNDLDALTTDLEKLFELKKQIDHLTKVYKQADTALRERLESAGLMNEDFQGLGFVHASVHRTKSFDGKLAASVLTPAEQKKCEKKVLDSALVKALFPEKYEACQADKGSWTMRLSLDD
ncbi:MAG: hypothetical protein ACTHJ9_14010 [Rhodanobacter sp.]